MLAGLRPLTEAWYTDGSAPSARRRSNQMIQA
jgi:hypothetical protein